ncbi:hypothetical protein [Providencia rettgeri]|uniref:hypothetical protein n=1 Tax=Providencia rettgeri TaxID=587 RepID=UPI0018C5D93E|nr:hypothetical protein [Providencia rettgeri]MBG5900100.1 hypothetical protein [Providencia rettgeri]
MNKSIRKIESEKESAIMHCRIGIYISIAGFLLIFANYMFDSDNSPILAGIIIGGGVVFWGINHDKVSNIKRELDNICYKKYGKNHKYSWNDIMDDEGEGL